jgi:hypothetical protein
VINPELTYYGVVINEKRELLLGPVEDYDFDTFFPPPDICRTPGFCYEIQVFYADPSNDSCSGG